MKTPKTYLEPRSSVIGTTDGVYCKVRDRRLRVLFVCFGNSCRSQMAEAFANAYGPDVMMAESAGLTPAAQVSSLARVVMEEKGISLRARKTRGFGGMSLDGYDLVINMTGTPLPGLASTPVVKALVRDPNGQDEMVYRQVRDRIEAIVEDLIHVLRLARMEQHGIARPGRPMTAVVGAA